MTTVIVFGPTGHVGSSVALSAHEFGAKKVVLAMRDTTKAIRGLTPEIESSRAFQHVQADLLEPESVAAAVAATSATRAFLYQNFTSPDNLLAVIKTLKGSGIEFVVFLSSASISPGTDLNAISPVTDPIAFEHAQVELNLLSVFGKEGFASVRPAFFATNANLWWGRMIASGRVRLYGADVKVDWITPEDIGRVSAAILSRRGLLSADDEAVWLVGPQQVSIRDGLLAISKAVSGKEVEIEDVNTEDGVQSLVDIGVPAPVATHLVETFEEVSASSKGVDGPVWVPVAQAWDKAAGMVEAYTGTPAMKLGDWIEKHKDEFRG